MNIITKQISELKPYKNNPKIHTDSQIDKIARSIELTKGLRQPIVIDKNGVIVCGHGRYLAAKKLGYDTGVTSKSKKKRHKSGEKTLRL